MDAVGREKLCWLKINKYKLHLKGVLSNSGKNYKRFKIQDLETITCTCKNNNKRYLTIQQTVKGNVRSGCVFLKNLPQSHKFSRTPGVIPNKNN